MKNCWRHRKYDALLWVAMVGIVCALEVPAKAFASVAEILGAGGAIPVIDAAVLTAATIGNGINTANLGVNTAALAQDVMILNTAIAEYQRIAALSRGGWTMAPQLPNIDITLDRIGDLAGWSVMMNGTVGIAPTVWANATLGITPSPEIWGEEIPGASKFLSRLASVDAIDGSASRCLDQIAQARGNWTLNQPMITSFLSSQVDDSDANNGTVGQLNIANGGIAQGNEERRTQTAIQACLIEQTALANKMQRDNIASELNRQATTLLELETAPTSWDGNTTFRQQIP